MNQKRNYQKELEQLISKQSKDDVKPSLFLHCCCAPCSSYVLEYLHNYFNITVYFYNPNISEYEEYEKRKKELMRYISEVEYSSEINIVSDDYDGETFIDKVKGYENEPERGSRCTICYRLRLEKTAAEAVKRDMDYFCTTLSISPHKDAVRLMNIGEELADKIYENNKIKYLPSDFKKNNGYKRSIELSREYDLYRQDFCGCLYSKKG